ncbi:hypothetical protein M6D81_10435 [Paenibacillus sp. J5C_2022]|uniref:hypothetical protein n=1 Tax=Paenibacillus sp. J5C2022 TaxID=2977129 RepID=UPI0021CFAC25|nr:hypothetical protein [Paenibacillus sp. J5C2022]MCU6709128.1 hypothetical protein [Paenibacillus sp. J5C2022]
MGQFLYEQFLNPSNQFRGKPLWSWNGELDEEQLIKQIHDFKVMGFGGFYMHARVGLKTRYLSDEWMRLTRVCAEEARRIGMEAWLYDEDRWPSGTAGGMVTSEPRYRLKFVRADWMEPSTFEWTADTIAAFHCELDGSDVRHCARIKRGESPVPTSSRKVLAFTITEMAASSFYNGATYLDTLNREATERFLEMTHEKYREGCANLFGNAIQGIFTDEPHRGSVLDGFGITNPDKERHLPWTYDLFERFQDTFGYDLTDRLPELFYRNNGESVSAVKWHYIELLQRMFLENFAIPVQEWCTKHGLRLTGHILHEDSLTAQTVMSGSVMRYYEHMEEPGIDVLTEGNRSYWVAKQLSSAARQLGKKWLFSELYGCTGWQMPFQGHKATGDWQALFGINARSHHLTWYTMEGESKRDFPGSIGPASAWWREYEKVEMYFSRLGSVMSQGKEICDILVINPVESVWCQVYCGWSSSLAAVSSEVIQIERQYKELFHFLAGAQLDFDYGDEHLLSQYGSISQDTSGVPVLQVGKSSYRVVVVAGLVTIRSSTLRLLEDFLNAGGQVVTAAAPPAYVDAQPSQTATQLLKRGDQVAWDEEAIEDACTPYQRVTIEAFDPVANERIRDLFCQVREVDEGYLALFMNMDRDNWHRQVRLRFSLHGSVEQWNALTGGRNRISATSGAHGMEITTDFPPSGERLYFIRTDQNPAATLPPYQPVYEEHVEGCWEGPFPYRLSEPNVCVLDRAEYRIDEGEWQAEIDILKADRMIRDKLKTDWRNNKMVQPWYALEHGLWPIAMLGSIALSFAFIIEQLPQDEHGNERTWYLAVEKPEQFAISINGKLLLATPTEEHWVNHCFKLLPLPVSMLRIGENRITLETAFHERVDLEPLYILGSFGVRLEGTKKILTRLADTMAVGDLVGQGLPFYGGMITFRIHTDKRRMVNAPMGANEIVNMDGNESDSVVHLLRLPSVNAACAKVVFEEGEEQLMPWTPFEADITGPVRAKAGFELQLYMTRRNTFGPLHMVPVYSNAYSPDHFHTEGDRYSDSYVLWPAGISESPQHIVRRRVSEAIRSEGEGG